MTETKIESWNLNGINNVGFALTETAARLPETIAVAAPGKSWSRKAPQFDQITFAQLEQQSNRLALGIHKSGIEPGTRLALMVPPGIDFVAWVFALFKAGVVVILIDPGMGRKNMIQCLAEAKPCGIVGIRMAQIARQIFRRKFRLAKNNVLVGGRYWPGCISEKKFDKLNPEEFNRPNIGREDPAAIIFTTGSTGPPKGVLYRHRTFIQQAEQVREHYNIQPGNTDVSGFPLFALFNTAMGTTTVFPEMDATRPAEVYPPNIIDAVERFRATHSFGSPALWNTVSTYCEKNEIQLRSIKRILSAGAPVPGHVLKRLTKIISPKGDIFTPYGATEALPIASNSASMILSETAAKTDLGHGTCVGQKFSGIEWRIIEITDQPLNEIAQTVECPVGEIGELIVKGPVVTDQYVTRQEATSFHKIIDGNEFWHRMGDVGYFDDQNRFWFCGRKSHRLETANRRMFTVPCEAIINTHPSIYRSALVGIGDVDQQTPVVIVEPWPDKYPVSVAEKRALIGELKELAAKHSLTENIVEFLIRKSLPVDIRHNSKIFREQLRPWAAEQISILKD